MDVLLTYQGATGDLVQAAVDAGARGLVLASAGAGSLTPSQAGAAGRVADRGIAIVVATRTGAGVVARPERGTADPRGGIAGPEGEGAPDARARARPAADGWQHSSTRRPTRFRGKGAASQG